MLLELLAQRLLGWPQLISTERFPQAWDSEMNAMLMDPLVSLDFDDGMDS